MNLETNDTEYKRELTDGLEREVVAFMNARNGGVIYIGVADDGTPIGVKDADRMQLEIKDRIKHNIAPSMMGLFDVSAEEQGGVTIIKLLLAGGAERPYYLRKYGMSERGCFIRIGSSCEPMPVRMIEDLFARRVRNSLSCIRSPRQDLNFEQLRIYYQEAGLSLPEKFAQSLELLTEDGLYNYDAYLLADENANAFMFAKYDGLDRIKLIESKDFGRCCLVKTCKQMLDRLEGVENHIINKLTPTIRKDYAYWNRSALREAVINAVIHNDYASSLVPKCEIFDNRLEITSAGSFADASAQEEFFAGYSVPRNKTIMRVFRDLGMVEQLGSGMPRILSAYGRTAFEFGLHHARIVMPISLEALQMERALSSLSMSKDGKSGAENLAPNLHQTCTKPALKNLSNIGCKRTAEILGLIKSDREITIDEISKKTGMAIRTVKHWISVLQKSGNLMHIGPSRSGHWEVVE